jgi:hypothetical protein
MNDNCPNNDCFSDSRQEGLERNAAKARKIGQRWLNDPSDKSVEFAKVEITDAGRDLGSRGRVPQCPPGTMVPSPGEWSKAPATYSATSKNFEMTNFTRKKIWKKIRRLIEKVTARSASPRIEG